MKHSFHAGNSEFALGIGRESGLARDSSWGRPVFRAPPLINPHVIFDPLPFRALQPLDRRCGESTARQPLPAG
jgi:hypothetical protein